MAAREPERRPAEDGGDPGAANAEEVFAAWLGRREDGRGEAFEALCDAHPGRGAELRRMQAGWARLGPLLEDGARPPAAMRTLPPSAGAALRALMDALRGRSAGFDRYDLRGEVGRGGMGVVERVWDPDLKRELARKRARDAAPTPSAETDAGSLQSLGRFLEEAQITGQLDHPGIVPVHELGIDDEGHAFFTMRLVRGDDLSVVFRHVAEGTEDWTQTRALSVLLKACEALSYAHAKGVVHRDVKPANVMVGRFGEVYVMDWGLARVLAGPGDDLRPASEAASAVLSDRRSSDADGSSALATMDGDVVGTAAYMSPEQARGELENIGPASDVYSMGAMLYELLAGAAPYSLDAGGTSRPGGQLEVWNRVREGPPPPLSSVAPDQPSELLAICEKAMARSIEARYEDVRELADDLRAYLENRVVKAHRTGAVVELTKWVQRNRLTAAAIAAAIVLAMGGLASTAWVQARARGQQEELNARLSNTNAALTEARDQARANADRALEQRDRADGEARRAEREAEIARRSREAADGVADYLVDLFKHADPEVALGTVVTARDLLERGAETLEAEAQKKPALAARLATALGTAYMGLGEGQRAEELFLRALALRAELGETEADADVWRDRNNLGFARHTQGRHAEALIDVAAAHEALGGLLGERDAETLEAGAGLGQVLRLAGRRAEAQELLTGLRALAEEELGPRHTVTLDILAELILLRPVGHEQTVADLRRLIDARAAELHPDHPDLGRLRTALAHSLWAQLKFGEAEEIYREILETATRVQGPDHPDTLTTSNNLGSVLRGAGELQESEEILRTAYERANQVLEPDHPVATALLENLANTLGHQGRFEEAEALHLEAVVRFGRVLGAEHPNTITPLRILAREKLRQGDLDGAEALLREHQELVRPDDTRSRGAAQRILDELEALRTGG